MTSYDVIIVGEGVLGMSLAFRLANKNPALQIAIISPVGSSGGASIASGAMLGFFSEVTKNTFANDYSREKFNISFNANTRWQAWLDLLDQPLEFIKGSFIVLNTESGQLDSDNYNATLKALDEYQQPYEVVDPTEIPGLNPIESCRPLCSIYTPNEHGIDGMKLMSALRAACDKQAGITFINDSVTSVKAAAGKVKSVLTLSNKQYYCNQVVLAAGAATQSIVDQTPEIKNRIPHIFSGVGISLLVKGENLGLKHTIRTPNRSFACGLHAMPREDGAYYLGATNNVTADVENQPRLGSTHFLMQSGMDQINQNMYRCQIAKTMVGNRPVSMDTFPLIGQTSVDGLWLMTGTCREGLQQSPYLSEIFADAMLDNKPNAHLNLFAPERMPINTLTREQAIEDAVQHFVSGAYEHRMLLPRLGYNQMLKEMLFQRLNKLYDDLEMDYILSPDVVLMFEDDYKKHVDIVKKAYAGLQAAHKGRPVIA